MKDVPVAPNQTLNFMNRLYQDSLLRDLDKTLKQHKTSALKPSYGLYKNA